MIEYIKRLRNREELKGSLKESFLILNSLFSVYKYRIYMVV